MAARRGGALYVLLGLVVCAAVLVAAVWAALRWWPGRGSANPVLPYQQRCTAPVNGQTAEVSLEQAHFAAIIAGVSVQRGLPARAASIALATALQESDLRNINYGDRDSIGLFQQRPSQGWGTVEQIMDPHYSTGKFYDALVKVKNWQTGDINDVAQAVQRSGVPDGYRKHVERAKILASALSGETEAAFSCLARDPRPAAATEYQTLVRKTYGGLAPIAVAPGPPARAEIAAANPRVQWSLAAASQAWAHGHGIASVQAGGRTWQPSGSAMPPWIATTPAPPGTHVIVVFSGS